MTKSNGRSAPNSNLTSSSPPPEPSIARCEQGITLHEFTRHQAGRDAAGRRCRMPRGDSHPSLCVNHARQELLTFQNRQNFAPELLGPIKDFQTAAAVNHALGRLYILLGANRIHTRQAAVLAYICQLMLQSLSGVKDEVSDVIDDKFRESELYRVIDSLPALDPELATPRGANGKP